MVCSSGCGSLRLTPSPRGGRCSARVMHRVRAARVEIPKPDGQGVRKLGIPGVLDRFVQQAVLQVLQKRWDPTFSEHSHGFRPGRSAKQAVHEAQQYIAEGYRWVVDLDLEKFFDRVNHDRLLAAGDERGAANRILKWIRAILRARARKDGWCSAWDVGTA